MGGPRCQLITRPSDRRPLFPPLDRQVSDEDFQLSRDGVPLTVHLGDLEPDGTVSVLGTGMSGEESVSVRVGADDTADDLRAAIIAELGHKDFKMMQPDGRPFDNV